MGDGSTTTILSSVITADMFNGVFDEITALLPVCMPAMITFIGVRKAISFVVGILHSA